MTQYLTRRELREAERSGGKPQATEVAVPESQAAPTPETEAPLVQEPAEANLNQEAVAQPAAVEFMSRRERRLAEAQGLTPPPVNLEQTETAPEVSAPSTETNAVVVPEVIFAAIEEASLEEALAESKTDSPIPSADFSSSSLLAEPSTQSIVLDVAPEAILLPLDTGEIFSTGSISILPDPTTGSLTGALDGLNVDDADRMDAVTGVITTVDPVSALDVINQRVTVGVVPGEMLRKGWWQPWAFAALGLALAVATIIATITIVTALGE